MKSKITTFTSGLTLVSLILCIGFLCTACACSTVGHEGQVQPPNTSYILKDRNYEEAVDFFQRAGFTDVTAEPIKDLNSQWATKDGAIESISIDGDTSYSASDWFEPDAKVVIKYHTYAE